MSLDWPTLVPHIAHEVRTLVRKGFSNAQLLERILGPAANADALEHLRAIADSHRDLNLLVSRLVLLADAESSSRHSSSLVDKVPLDMAVLGAKIECKEAIQREEAELVVQPLPQCLVPQKIQVVIRELLDNSLRFRHPERPLRVVVEGEEDGKRIRVRISDNGTGIELAYAAKLFQPFQGLDARRSGFGLGLAIARAIMEAAGGEIYSEPTEQGATFVFELPNS